jgi:hypothetical protein
VHLDIDEKLKSDLDNIVSDNNNDKINEVRAVTNSDNILLYCSMGIWNSMYNNNQSVLSRRTYSTAVCTRYQLQEDTDLYGGSGSGNPCWK